MHTHCCADFTNCSLKWGSEPAFGTNLHLYLVHHSLWNLFWRLWTQPTKVGSSLQLRPCEVPLNNANCTLKLKLSMHSIKASYRSYLTYSSIYFWVENHGIYYLTIAKWLPLAPLFLYKEWSPYLNGGAPFWHDIKTFKDK